MNTLSLFFKRFSGVYDGPRPSRDWHMLLVVAFFLLMAVTSWSLWVFQTISTGGTVGVAPSFTAKPEQRSNPVDTVRTVYGERAAEAANYDAGVYRYTDPSQ